MLESDIANSYKTLFKALILWSSKPWGFIYVDVFQSKKNLIGFQDF